MKKLLLAVSAAALLGLAAPALACDGRGPGFGDMGAMFFAGDANSDGQVSRAEFNAQHAQHFTTMDADHNGEISRDEMRAGMHAMRQGGRGNFGHGAMLDRADANNDGAISRDEFLAMPLAHFNALDADHDGAISASERPTAPPDGARGYGHRRGPGGPDGADRPNPDANNDGRITRAEFDAAGAARFGSLDANHNGVVTRAEFDAAAPAPPASNR